MHLCSTPIIAAQLEIDIYICKITGQSFSSLTADWLFVKNTATHSSKLICIDDYTLVNEYKDCLNDDCKDCLNDEYDVNTVPFRQMILHIMLLLFQCSKTVYSWNMPTEDTFNKGLRRKRFSVKIGSNLFSFSGPQH